MSPDVDADVKQAEQFHAQLSQMEQWALETASEYRTVANLIEDDEVDGITGDPEELRQAAAIIQRVATRIRAGDKSIAKTPAEAGGG